MIKAMTSLFIFLANKLLNILRFIMLQRWQYFTQL